MNRTPLVTALSVLLLVVIAAGVYLGLGARPSLGLDLQGGISAIYTAQLPPGQDVPEDFEEVIDEAIEVIRARVDSLGVAEPDISRSGTDILVQLPGVDDEERVQELIGTTAQLTFRPVFDTIAPGDPRYDADPSSEDFDQTRQIIEASELAYLDDRLSPNDDIELYDVNPDCGPILAEDELPEDLPNDAIGILCGTEDSAVPGPDGGELLPIKYVVGMASLTGDRIEGAFASFGQTGGVDVALELDNEGATQFRIITEQLACERATPGQGRFAITLDNIVESAPTMSDNVQCGVGIRDGNASITVGGESVREQEEQAQDLALILRTGALPISLEPQTFQTVSATLGTDSLQAGLLAGGLGLLLVGAWLIWFYRTLGVVAMLGLSIFGVLIMGIITLLGQVGFALTLAGVAGLIVAIGITADSSIIFFERIRDEVNLGKTVRTAVRKAFTSAFRTNLAGNTVTLAAAVILYFLAVGPVRGFALMLGIATVLDLLIMGLFTRPIVFLMSTTKLLNRRTVRAADTAAVATVGSNR